MQEQKGINQTPRFRKKNYICLNHNDYENTYELNSFFCLIRILKMCRRIDVRQFKNRSTTKK